MDLEVDQAFELGDSRRVIQEITTHTCSQPRGMVIYALYRRVVRWSTKATEWWYLRQGYCKRETFEQWARKAKKVAGG